MLQYPQTSSMQQHHQQPPQQLQQQHASGASQPPAGASYLTPSSSSFLAPNHFSGNSDGRNGSIHLPLGVSHVDPDSYLTSPTQSGLVNPIQTGMGSVTNPSLSGLSNAHQLAFANPVQTGMGNSSQAAGLYQRPSSAQPQGPRQNMQVKPCCSCHAVTKVTMICSCRALLHSWSTTIVQLRSAHSCSTAEHQIIQLFACDTVDSEDSLLITAGCIGSCAHRYFASCKASCHSTMCK